MLVGSSLIHVFQEKVAGYMGPSGPATNPLLSSWNTSRVAAPCGLTSCSYCGEDIPDANCGGVAIGTCPWKFISCGRDNSTGLIRVTAVSRSSLYVWQWPPLHTLASGRNWLNLMAYLHKASGYLQDYLQTCVSLRLCGLPEKCNAGPKTGLSILKAFYCPNPTSSLSLAPVHSKTNELVQLLTAISLALCRLT